MDPMTAAIGQAMPALVGAFLNKGSEKNAAKRQKSLMLGLIRKERKFFLKDRRSERKYDATRLADDRQYAEGMLSDERAYAEQRLGEDRAYSEAERQRDQAEYMADRWKVQKASDNRAEMMAGSRGVNFSKLRDDAIAAGFNPLTAMSMAHAYSTEVPYQNTMTPYSAGPAYHVSGAGYGPGAGGGGSAGAPVMSSPGAPHSFQMNGAGYASSIGTPSLSSGSFIAEAMSRGVDTYFNQSVANDSQAQAIRNAATAKAQYDAVLASTPRGFGYDLTKQAPFTPATTLGTPDFAVQENVQALPAPSDEATTPAVKPVYIGGAEVPPLPGWTDNETIEGRDGEIVGLASSAVRGALYGARGLGGIANSWASGINAIHDRFGEIRGIPPLRPTSTDFYLDTGVEPYIPPIRSRRTYTSSGARR